MPQSLSSVLIHLVFSTKCREPWIRPGIESELFAFGTAVLKNHGCPTLAMGGTADHVHVLLNLARVKSIAAIVEELKTSTSKWIKTKGDGFQGFHWQTGYAAFSVSQSNVADVVEYIRRQKEHHRGRAAIGATRANSAAFDCAPFGAWRREKIGGCASFQGRVPLAIAFRPFGAWKMSRPSSSRHEP